MWRVAERITAPTLVITGRQDRLVDVRVAPAVAKVIPDSRLLVLDGVGHVAQMERPRIVARAVAAMLDEVKERPQRQQQPYPQPQRHPGPAPRRSCPAATGSVSLPDRGYFLRSGPHEHSHDSSVSGSGTQHETVI